MGLPEIQAIKKLTPAQVYKGKEATPKVKASLQPKVQKPIAKRSVKAQAKFKDQLEQSAMDREFYAEIWSASPHTCQCGCGKKLGNEPLTTYFHHLLEKQSYPAFRHTPENIMILAPECHKAINDGGLDKRPEVKRRTAQALKLLLK